MIKVNIEVLHEKWLQRFSSFATEYMEHKHGKGSDEALILIDHNDNDLFEFEIKDRITLPHGTGNLCSSLAKASLSYLPYMPIDRVIGAEGLEKFGKNTFCLHSLLLALYPRDANEIFKRNIAGTVVLSLADELISTSNEPHACHAAGAGIGITMLKKFRSKQCPTSTDAEAIQKANGFYISFLD